MKRTKDFAFVTSWDDGNAADLQIAEILDGLGLKGTFFIPSRWERRTLKDSQIRQLSENHEIGCHTFSHRDLTKLSRSDLDDELRWPLAMLESLTYKKVDSIAYPFGAYNQNVIEKAKEVGYSCGRTTYAAIFAELSIGEGAWDPMAMHPTDHLFHQRLSPMHTAKQLLRLPKVDLLTKGGVEAIVKVVEGRGRFLHFWGHSWAIEENGQWDKLRQVFQFIAQNTSARPKTFSELAST